MSLSNGTAQPCMGKSNVHESLSEVTDLAIFDLVCIGFGVSGLALAVALADGDYGSKKALFVDRHDGFTWNYADILAENPVASSFLHDLIMWQNARSQYTLINFLHVTGQLLTFLNTLTQMAPPRLLMNSYFHWAAEQVEQKGWVRYGQDAVCIRPVEATGIQNRVVHWCVHLRNSKTQHVSVIQAKRVVIATGLSPIIPPLLATPQIRPFVVHGSMCAKLLERINDGTQTLDIAVVGVNQEAAEIFKHVHSAGGQHRATLFAGDTVLRPGQDYSSDDTVHEAATGLHNVDPNTIESLQNLQYAQTISQPNEKLRQFQVQMMSDVIGCARDGIRVRLITRNLQTNEVTLSPQAFDIVIAATGYRFEVDCRLYSDVAFLLDSNTLKPNRHYGANWRLDCLASDCGLWVLGLQEELRARRDDFRWIAEHSVSPILEHLAK